MTFFGLSILIASISFICYKHPPTTWSFLAWLRQPQGIPPSIQEPLPTITKTHDTDNDTEKEKPTEKETAEVPATLKKEETDRIAMPPPPPPTIKSPSSPTTPRAKPTPSSSSVPSFTLSSSDTETMPPPSFPALNSAQRASGGIRGQPPRLNAIPAQTSSLMAPPPRPSPLPNRGGPLPNRSPASTTSSSSLALPPTHSSIPAKPRKKVQLTPNHSPLDWARLSSSPHHNLNGLPPNTPYLKVPPSLLRQFTGRKGKDAWTVLGGKVYNITPYLPYHPGGEGELMRCAGKDGTRLFGEVHPWVNWEGMLSGCLVGVAVEEAEAHAGGGGMEDMD